MRGGLWDTEGHAAFNVFRLQNQRIQPLVWGNTGDLKSSVLLHKVVTSINRWMLVFALSIALYLTAARRRTYRWPAAARLTHLIRVSGSRRQRDRNEHTTHTNTQTHQHTHYLHTHSVFCRRVLTGSCLRFKHLPETLVWFDGNVQNSR